MNIAICDDDYQALTSIAKIMESCIISNNLEAEISIVTQNQNEIYEGIINHKIDVLFLDIDFANVGMNGIDFALKLRKFNKNFILIFMTGYFEYAMNSFCCKTFDYVSKPADIAKVDKVIKRLKNDLCEVELGLFKVNKDYMIRTKDILFIERNKSKATVYTKDSVYQSCCSLNVLEQELPNTFVRVHRSYIVNVEQIVKINRENKSIYFEDNLTCPLGQFYSKL